MPALKGRKTRHLRIARRSPSRLVIRSRSKNSSKGMAYFRETPARSLKVGTSMVHRLMLFAKLESGYQFIESRWWKKNSPWTGPKSAHRLKVAALFAVVSLRISTMAACIASSARVVRGLPSHTLEPIDHATLRHRPRVPQYVYKCGPHHGQIQERLLVPAPEAPREKLQEECGRSTAREESRAPRLELTALFGGAG